MSESLKPVFTDVVGRKIIPHIIHNADGEHAQLSVGLLNEESGELTEILRLNSYDATLLARSCNLFLKNSFSVSFTEINSMLTEKDRAEIIDGEGLEEVRETVIEEKAKF